MSNARRIKSSTGRKYDQMRDWEQVKETLKQFDAKLERAHENKLQSENTIKEAMLKQTSKVYNKMQIKMEKEENDFMDVFAKSVKKREQREKQKKEANNNFALQIEDVVEKRQTKEYSRAQKTA